MHNRYQVNKYRSDMKSPLSPLSATLPAPFRAGGRKLVILDEADNLFGREDSGGIGAIVDTIRQAGQPIVLIANDFYALSRRSSSLRSLCKTIKFKSVHPSSAKAVLRRVAKGE